VIDALCGFADLLRSHGADVGSAELIDTARALNSIDLADRHAVRRAMVLTIAWSARCPELFGQLFDDFFDGRDLDVLDAVEPDPARLDTVTLDTATLDADTIDAARIHTDEAVAVNSDDPVDGSSAGDQPPPTPAAPEPSRAAQDGPAQVAGTGELSAVPPRDDGASAATDEGALIVLPAAPPDAPLELARSALAAAVERRRSAAIAVSARPPRSNTVLTDPLTSADRAQLGRIVHRLDRQLDGAASWRRARNAHGTIDLRRTLRRSVTTGGLPVDLRHVGRRHDSARLVVLVDLSMSVRGTARLVLHLVHRMRSMMGSVHAFGFVDSCVPIDRALRMAEPTEAIEHVLGLVDVDAASDPGAALRQWWMQWHHLVTPSTHVMILSDGRCNGHDPAIDIVERFARRSASTVWISPEPQGAWTLGRGEMAQYASHVDRAVSVRSLADLDLLVPSGRRGARLRRGALV